MYNIKLRYYIFNVGASEICIIYVLRYYSYFEIYVM